MLNKKKYQDQIIKIAKKYLMGIIEFDQLVDTFIKNDKLLKIFRGSIKQSSGRNFPSKEKLLIIKNKYWQRHDFYNIMFSYLFVLGIEVDNYSPEYYCFKQINRVGPKWFQPDIIFYKINLKI